MVWLWNRKCSETGLKRCCSGTVSNKCVRHQHQHAVERVIGSGTGRLPVIHLLLLPMGRCADVASAIIILTPKNGVVSFDIQTVDQLYSLEVVC